MVYSVKSKMEPPSKKEKVDPQEAQAASYSGTSLELKCVNTIRCLAADMVQKANSGHPGAPMGCAPMAHLLWSSSSSGGAGRKHSARNPDWWNRDRFVLSNGHACALQYIMLHLGGYEDCKMDDLKAFRQVGSTTPGHPENFCTKGESFPSCSRVNLERVNLVFRTFFRLEDARRTKLTITNPSDRCGGLHRSPRAGHLERRRHGYRGEAPRCHLQHGRLP